LILDLRYNPGGNVNTATKLGSMITGIDNEVFAILKYNSDLESNNSTYDFSNTLSESETAINSLGLTTLYVLTSNRSASASEMIINSLRSYIEVIQIGTKTVGKSQASVTIYDSPTFQKKDVNPSHFYAMQPLVAITVNKNNEAVPSAGLIPQIEIAEDISNYGVLGEVSEPLLAAALTEILGSGRRSRNEPNLIKPISDSDSFIAHSEEMYID
jgi:C-terminal processing protease CtpA/Prc